MDYFKFMKREWERVRRLPIQEGPLELPPSLTTTYANFPDIATYTKQTGWALRKNRSIALLNDSTTSAQVKGNGSISVFCCIM
jgi:hypothetical protein